MRVTTQWIWCSAVLALAGGLAGGCTLLIDSDQYVGGGTDAGTGDGGMVDPDAPSTPEIDLGPDAPRTADDLTVTITTESTDPLEGTIEYEYRWLRDGEVVAGETGTTLDAASTAKGETWRVEVTPVASPGARRGAPATAEVTIENTPAVMTAVGLDGYERIVGERIRALAGRVVDADGDAAAPRYQWYREDTPIDGATSVTLDTTALAAGDRVRLEAWAFDGEDGPRVSVGPITLLERVTRWRQLLPTPVDEGFPGYFYDAPRRRVVHVVGSTAWELADEGGRLRPYRLPASGEAPGADWQFPLQLHDTIHDRVLVVDPNDANRIVALDLSQRGAEQWTTIITGGTPPGRVFGTTVWFDEANGRFWLYGGSIGGEPPGSRLFSLDVRTEGAETWQEHTFAGDAPTPLVWAAAAVDPTTPGRAFLFGGGAPTGGDGFDLQTRIFQFDTSGAEVAVTELASTLPHPVLLAVAAPDPRGGGRILLAGGGASADTPAVPSGVLSFDVATGAITAVSDAGAAGIAGFLVPDPDAPGTMLHGTLSGLLDEASVASLTLERIDPSTPELTVVSTEVRPPQITQAVGFVESNRLRFAFGTVNGFEPHDEVWELDPVSMRWSEIETLPDAVSDTSPTPRFGVVAQTDYGASSPHFGGQLFGGQSGSSALADGEVWELTRDERWLWRTLAAGETAPAPRTGVAVLQGYCGADTMVYFGGERLDGTLLADNGMLICAAGDRMRDCTWELAVTGGTPPSARSYATATRTVDGGVAYVFGGRTASGATNELYSFESCFGGAAPWNRLTPTGTAPEPRWGHSTTFVEPESGGLPSFLVFGGTNAVGVGGTFSDVRRLVVITATSARWEDVSITGDSPGPRGFHLAWYDEPRARLIVYGGTESDNDALGDLWELIVVP